MATPGKLKLCPRKLPKWQPYCNENVKLPSADGKDLKGIELKRKHRYRRLRGEPCGRNMVDVSSKWSDYSDFHLKSPPRSWMRSRPGQFVPINRQSGSAYHGTHSATEPPVRVCTLTPICQMHSIHCHSCPFSTSSLTFQQLMDLRGNVCSCKLTARRCLAPLTTVSLRETIF